VEVASYRQNQSAISRPMSKGRQWQPTPKNLPSTQCSRAIPVALTGLWFLPNRPKGWILPLIIIMYSWRLTSRHCESFYRFLLSLKINQQNTMNENDKIIRKKYINNMKTVNWGCHRLTAQGAGLLRCCAVWLGNLFPKFRRNVPPSSSGLWDNSGTHNPWIWRRYVTSKRREAAVQPLCAISQKTCCLNTKTRLQIFQRCVISSGWSGNLVATLAIIFTRVVYLASHSVGIKVSCYYRRFTYVTGNLWSTLHLEFSLSLSLSLPHTHTHTHTNRAL
jgi:hypothetical protein